MHKLNRVSRKALFLSVLPFGFFASGAFAGPAATYAVFTGTYIGGGDSGTATVAFGSDGSVQCTFASSASPLLNTTALGASLNSGWAGIGFTCAGAVGPLTFGHQPPLIGVVGTQTFPPTGTYPDISFNGTWFNNLGDRGTFQVAYSAAASNAPAH